MSCFQAIVEPSEITDTIAAAVPQCLGHHNIGAENEIPQDWDDVIIGCLKQRDKEGYMEAVRNLLEACEMMPYGQFVSRLEQTGAAILKAGRMSRNAEGKENGRGSLRERIAALTGREELLLWLESLYDEAAIQISKISSHSTAAMMEEAVDYIRNNYDDSNLNVNLLADKLNVGAAFCILQRTIYLER